MALVPLRQAGRLGASFNYPLLGTVVVLCALGLWNLASASQTAHAEVWLSQAMWLGLGFGLVALLCAFDYRHFLQLTYPLYVGVIGLLVATLFFGEVHKGAQRWLSLGPVGFQPSELAKLAVVLALARFYHERKEPPDGFRLRDLGWPAGLVLLPVALVVRQPDLGTSLLILAIGATLVLFGRVERRTLFALSVGCVVVASAGWLWFLEDYQRARVVAFLDPEGDTQRGGYHASQSIIAIGSGGLSGKGWGEGTQTQLRFLPEQHTDFVFAVWAEEQGFVGSLVLLALYALLLGLALGVAMHAKERFGVFLAIGVSALIFWHVLVNVGMVTGLMPVVGVTLPLLSYGGSSVIISLAAVGLLLNVSMRRFLF